MASLEFLKDKATTQYLSERADVETDELPLYYVFR